MKFTKIKFCVPRLCWVFRSQYFGQILEGRNVIGGGTPSNGEMHPTTPNAFCVEYIQLYDQTG